MTVAHLRVTMPAGGFPVEQHVHVLAAHRVAGAGGDERAAGAPGEVDVDGVRGRARQDDAGDRPRARGADPPFDPDFELPPGPSPRTRG